VARPGMGPAVLRPGMGPSMVRPGMGIQPGLDVATEGGRSRCRGGQRPPV